MKRPELQAIKTPHGSGECESLGAAVRAGLGRTTSELCLSCGYLVPPDFLKPLTVSEVKVP